MAAADGGFDSPGEDLVAALAGLEPGAHTIGLRARDAAGNWSAASLLAISVPAPPVSPPAVPSDVPAGPAPPVATPPLARARVETTVSEGFEHGLGAWARRVGPVKAVRDAAISGRRGLRVLSAAAGAFVRRPLLEASADVELAFELRPRTLSSARAWSEIAAIDGADGTPLATAELQAPGRGPLRLRLSTIAAGGMIRRSKPYAISRGRSAVALRLDSEHAAILIDGRERAALTRGANGALGTTVALGAWRSLPSRSTGYLDIDNVSVRIAPEAT
jgi:hypothetical protein